MMTNSFINQPDDSIKRISGPAPEYQSFTERKKLERQRRIIRGYHDSHLGNGYAARGEVTSSPRDTPRKEGSEKYTRQGLNATASLGGSLEVRSSINRSGGGTNSGTPPRATFTEPPTRGYNPYG